MATSQAWRVWCCRPWQARRATARLAADFRNTRFETDAIRLCKGDTVVWGSSANKGVYFVKADGPYTATGKRIGGFYACEADVKKAGYKIE